MATSDPTKFKRVKDLARPEICFCVARIPQSSRLFYGASDAKVYAVDMGVEKPEPVGLEGHSSYVTGIALAGQQLVSGSYDGKLIWWNVDTHEKVRVIDAHERWIRGVVASPDGKWIASVSDDMLCKVWNAETGTLIHTLADHKAITPNDYPSMLYACAFSGDGALLATGDKTGHIAIWEVATGKKIGNVEAPGMYTWDPTQRRHSIGGIRSLAFSPDNRLLVAGGIGKINNIDHLDGPSRLEVFEWRESKPGREVADSKLKGLVEKLAFHPGGDWLVGAGGDNGGFVNFYDSKEHKLFHQDKAPMHVHSFVLNESCDTMYGVGHRKIVVWELKAE